MFVIPDDEAFRNSVAYIEGWSRKIKEERPAFITSVCGKAWQCVEELVKSVDKALLQEQAEIENAMEDFEKIMAGNIPFDDMER